LAEQNNDQGAVELGATAEFLPGPADLHHADARQTIAGLWKEELPQGPGRTLMEILNDAREGKTKAQFVVGENPAQSEADMEKAIGLLSKLDCLVVQDMFLTKTAELADVVFPAFFLGLLIDELRQGRPQVGAALIAAAVALALIPFTPPGIPIIASCVGALVALRGRGAA
jgi:hypothetical protein